MQWCRSNGQVICAIALVALVAGAGGCWRLCTRSGEMAYLPSHSGAQWIVDARLPETRVRHGCRRAGMTKQKVFHVKHLRMILIRDDFRRNREIFAP